MTQRALQSSARLVLLFAPSDALSDQAAAAAVAALTAVAALAGALTAGAEAKTAPAELAQTVTLLHDAVLLTPVAPMPLQARATQQPRP